MDCFRNRLHVCLRLRCIHHHLSDRRSDHRRADLGIGTVVAIAFIALIIFLLFRKPAKADFTEGLRRMSVDAN